MTLEYAELHCHTAYSFLDGASQPNELVERAQALGYRAIAVTDHDGLYGAMEFAQAARRAGIQPITGAELTLNDGSHLTLLVETPTGYANLCRLLTQAHANDRVNAPASGQNEPSLPLEALEARTEGLILLTGCRRSRLVQAVDAGRLGEARALLERYRERWGTRNVFVELQNHLVQGDRQRMRTLARLAAEAGLPCVATGDVHYHDAALYRLQDVLVAIHHRTTLDASHQLRRPNAEFFLHERATIAERFREQPEALRNTLVIAERCAAFDLTRDLNYRFPDANTAPGETADDLLRRETERMLEVRYRDDPAMHAKARARLEGELVLVRKHGLAGFFLIYHRIMELAKEVAAEIRGRGPRSLGDLPPGRGRGSSVSSIICYLLGLSHIDPLRYNLFVGRFLNDEMASVPDIDLDFPRDIRAQLIERVYDEYGHDHAALVCAFPTYHARSAIREIGKVLGLPASDLDRFARLSERGSAEHLDFEMERLPEFRNRRDAPLWRELIELSEQIAGLPRHVSQHSGGMIISSRPLNEIVPIQPAAMENRFVCQWDKDSCNDARFVKIDFLALGMLSLVEECLDLIAANGKPPVDLSRIDFSDRSVYDMIGQGDTIGTFQIESRAQIQTLVRTLPANLEDLIVQVAIVRPGPITGGAMNPYIRQRQLLRRWGRARPTYDHPSLEPILRETYGGILYQEQVLQVAEALAGFSPGRADAFRRTMSRKRSKEGMESFWQAFRQGAKEKHGVDEELARTVFDKLLGFAAYGFPKSHAAAFALLAYQSCWLKRYYPAEFCCALLNNQPMGFYSPNVIVNDAQRHGIRVAPPDINFSGAQCTVEKRGTEQVRIGFSFVDGIGEDAADTLVRERLRGGPYRSLRDLIRRTRLKREVLERLILLGACRSFGLRRRELLWQLGLIIADRRVGSRKRTESWQLALDLPVRQDMVDLPEMGEWDTLHADYDLLKLSPDHHPLGLLRPVLPAHYVQAADLPELSNHRQLQIAGLVVCRQRPMTAKGMLFMLLEDETGLANIIVHPPLYNERRMVVRGSPFVTITGRLQLRDGTVNIVASDIETLDASAPEPPVSPTVQSLLEQANELRALPSERDDELLAQLRLTAPPAHDFR
jgi:error-prone DNA polymerase